MQKFAQLCVCLLIGSLLVGCAPLIFFDESQPSFVKKEAKFKKRFLGEYANYQDSSVINVFDQSIWIRPDWFDEQRGDTLFRISENSILKYYKKKYFLNYKDIDGYWMLQLMDLKDEKLSFYCLTLPDSDEEMTELGTMMEIRNECGELVKVVMHPTRKGINQLIRDDNLDKLSEYHRIDDQH
ncbi:MAG: hypothetical protein ABJG78_15865 [Cyclobacteriaceae bacterium]